MAGEQGGKPAFAFDLSTGITPPTPLDQQVIARGPSANVSRPPETPQMERAAAEPVSDTAGSEAIVEVEPMDAVEPYAPEDDPRTRLRRVTGRHDEMETGVSAGERLASSLSTLTEIALSSVADRVNDLTTKAEERFKNREPKPFLGGSKTNNQGELMTSMEQTGQPGAELALTGEESTGNGFRIPFSWGQSKAEIEPINLVDIAEYGPQVTQQATELLEEYVDPLIADAPIGQWLRNGAELRVTTVWIEGAEARQEEMHGVSERKARRNPNALTEARNRSIEEFAKEAGRIGVGKIIDLSISPEEATRNAFGLLEVKTFNSEIDGCMVADGTMVSRAIEEASQRMESQGDVDMFGVAGGSVLARTDTYWDIERTDGRGKSADTVILVADEAEDIHYVAATSQISVQAPGMEPQTRNKVTAFALNPKIASRAVQAMKSQGTRNIVTHGDAHHEVVTRVSEDLTKLDAWSSDVQAIGSRADSPIQAWTPDKPLAELTGSADGIVDGTVIEGQTSQKV